MTTRPVTIADVRAALPEHWRAKFDQDIDDTAAADLESKLAHWHAMAPKLHALNEDREDVDHTHALLQQRDEILRRSPEAQEALRLHLDATSDAA